MFINNAVQQYAYNELSLVERQAQTQNRLFYSSIIHTAALTGRFHHQPPCR